MRPIRKLAGDGAVDVAEAAGDDRGERLERERRAHVGKMLKSGETSAAAAAASAAESAKVTIAVRCTSTPTTAHASRFCDIARIARPVRVRASRTRSSPQKITRLAAEHEQPLPGHAEAAHVEDARGQRGGHLLGLRAEDDDGEVGHHDRASPAWR